MKDAKNPTTIVIFKEELLHRSSPALMKAHVVNSAGLITDASPLRLNVPPPYALVFRNCVIVQAAAICPLSIASRLNTRLLKISWMFLLLVSDFCILLKVFFMMLSPQSHLFLPPTVVARHLVLQLLGFHSICDVVKVL